MSAPFQITRHSPAALLSPYLHSYWITKVSAEGNLPKMSMPPTGFATILLSFGTAPIQLRNYGHEWITGSPAIISGQYFNYTEVRLPASYETIGVFVKPIALHQVLGIEMNTLTHSLVNAADILGSDINDLVYRLREFASDEERIREVDSYFLRKFRIAKYNAPIVYDAISLMTEKNGNIRMAAVADYFKCSTRYLEKQFKATTGISPKYMARIIQFNYTLSILKSDPKVRWPDLVTRSGYYDQAHLIKAFTEFTGKAPLPYRDTNNELTEIHL